MKKTGKIGLIALLCFAIMTGTIYADSGITGTKSAVEGYGTSDDVALKSFDLQFSTQSLNYIKETSSTIRDLGDGDAYVEATTSTYGSVDYLNLKTYLEVWNGSSWETVDSWSKTAYGTDSISLSKVKNVTRNEYYRVRTTHTIKENGTTETDETITSYITIE